MMITHVHTSLSKYYFWTFLPQLCNILLEHQHFEFVQHLIILHKMVKLSNFTNSLSSLHMITHFRTTVTSVSLLQINVSINILISIFLATLGTCFLSPQLNSTKSCLDCLQKQHQLLH